MKINRAFIIRILRWAAANPQGLTVRYFKRYMNAAQRDALLATEYPKGLKGLVRKEIVPSPKQPRQPCFRFMATDVGRTLLRDLETNPRAKPKFPRGTQGFVSAAARVLAAKRRLVPIRKSKNQAKYETVMANPAYKVADYDEPPDLDVSPSDPEFKNLPMLEKIRILRARKRESGERQ